MSLSQLGQRNWVRGDSYVRDLATHHTRRSEIQIVYRFCIRFAFFGAKTGPSAANAELRKTLQPQGQANRAQRGKTPFLNYKTVALPLSYAGAPKRVNPLSRQSSTNPFARHL